MSAFQPHRGAEEAAAQARPAVLPRLEAVARLTESEPTEARLELGHLQGPLPTQTTLGSHRDQPQHTRARPTLGLVTGLIMVSMEDKQTNKH